RKPFTPRALPAPDVHRGLPVVHLTVESRAVRSDGPLSLRAGLLGLRKGCDRMSWRCSRRLAGGTAPLPVSSVGRLWVRSCAAANPSPDTGRCCRGFAACCLQRRQEPAGCPGLTFRSALTPAPHGPSFVDPSRGYLPP